jgi:hypothetical protein
MQHTQMNGAEMTADRSLQKTPPTRHSSTAVLFAVLLDLLVAATPATAGRVIEGDLGSCRFELPKEKTTLVYDGSGGSQKSRFSTIDEDGERRSFGRLEIKIPNRNTPLFVVLFSGGATEWDMIIEPGADIAGILVLAEGDQVVSNVPAQTTLGFSIKDVGQGPGCPDGIHFDQMGNRQWPLRRMLDYEMSTRIDEYFSSNTHANTPGPWPECAYISCFGERLHRPNMPSPSIWSRVFGSSPKSGAEAGTIRTSGTVHVR